MLLKKEEFYLLKRTKFKNCKIISFSDPLLGRFLLPSCHPSSDPLVPLPLYLTSHGEIPLSFKEFKHAIPDFRRN
jgi:hypothetical protein